MGLKEVGQTELVDIKLDKSRHFHIFHFKASVGRLNQDRLLDAPEIGERYRDSNMVEQFIKFPEFTISVNSVKKEIKGSKENKRKPQAILVSAQYSTIEIGAGPGFSSVYPITSVDNGKLLYLISNITSSSSTSTIHLEHICISKGTVLVTLALPDLWASVQWLYECKEDKIPKDLATVLNTRYKKSPSTFSWLDSGESHAFPAVTIPTSHDEFSDDTVTLDISSLETVLFFVFLLYFIVIGRPIARRVRKGMAGRIAFKEVCLPISTPLLLFSLLVTYIIYHRSTPQSIRNLDIPQSAEDELTRHPEPFSKLKPLFAIVTPCYNQSEYLDESSRSIFRQSYPHWEWYIIRDGGSLDCLTEALRIQKANPGRAIHVYDKPNSGLAGYS